MKLAAPTVQWIVVSMDDINRNIALGQTLHLAAKCDKRAQAPISGIIEVSGNNEEIGFGFNRVIDDGFESAEGRRLKTVTKLWSRIRETAKRAVQMQIRCMDEAQRVHAELVYENADSSGPIAPTVPSVQSS